MSNRNDILRFLSRLYLNNFIDYNILRFDAQESTPTIDFCFKSCKIDNKNNS